MLKRIYNLALLFTSIFVFAVWTLLGQINTDLISSPVIRYVIMTFISFIFAYGFFHGSANIAIFLSDRMVLIKKLILGSSYIEGVWVGYSLEKSCTNLDVASSVPRYTVRTIEQTMDKITISTKAYNENKLMLSSTTSIAAAIDVSKNTLIYVSEIVDTGSRKFAYLQLHKNGRSAPDEMNGTVAYSGNECNREVRAKRLFDISNEYDSKSLVDEAEKLYKKEMGLL